MITKKITDFAVDLDNVFKSYRDVKGFKVISRKALNGLSLKVKRGEVHGLLGPNGAGKTTSFKLILGFATPDEGNVEVMGGNPYDKEVRSEIGFLPEQPYFYPHMRGIELLNHYATVCGIPKARDISSDLLDLVGLSNAVNLKIANYSRGMLQRLGIAQALINDPELLVLDEPSSGLDPLGQEDMKSLIKRFKADGKTVLLSSHQLSSVEETCDTVTIISDGRAREEGSISSLLIQNDQIVFEIVSELQEIPWDLLELASSTSDSSGTTILTVPADKKSQAIKIIAQNEVELLSMRRSEQSLEDHFIRLMRIDED